MCSMIKERKDERKSDQTRDYKKLLMLFEMYVN